MKKELLRETSQQVAAAWAIGWLAFSCSPPDPPTTTHLPAPLVVRATGHVVTQDRVNLPEVLPLGRQHVVKAGKPAVIAVRNPRKSFETRFVEVGEPLRCTPGQAPYAVPGVVPAVHHPVPAGRPNVIPATLPYTKDYNPYNFTNFGLSQGLVESKVHQVVQDRKGNLWFGTFNGISKFNGKTFENYTKKEGLADNFVESIFEDRAGTMWFGFREGLTRYDGKTFTNYTVREGLSDAHVMAILQDRAGNMWFATRGNGVSRLDKNGTSFTHFTEKEGFANVVNCIAEDPKGNLWFGTDGNGAIHYDGKQFSHFTKKEGLTHQSVRSVFTDRAGVVWFGTWSGVTSYDGRHFSHVVGLTEGWVNCLKADRSGTIWFGALPGGVFFLDKTKRFIGHYTTNEGLADNDVPSLVEDRAGNLWFATFQGVTKYSNLFRTLTKKDGLVGNAARSLWEDRRGNVWVGSLRSGVSRFDSTGQTIRNFTPTEGLSSDDVLTILEDNAGNRWFGLQYGCLNRLSADGRFFTHFLDSGELIVCVFQDRAGNIWYSSRQKGGVFRIDQRSKTRTHFTTAQGLPHRLVVKIFQDRDGNMWFCTFGGIARLAKDGTTMIRYTEREGMSAGIVESMLEDQAGNLWFGMLGSGLTRLDKHRRYFMHFTEKQGLCHNTVFGILEDHLGNIWASTRTGLSKLSKPVLQTLSPRRKSEEETKLEDSRPHETVLFKNYTAENGYLGFGEGRYYLMEDRKGNIWIPMMDRLTIYNPRTDRENLEIPPVEITNVNLYNEAITWQKDTSFTLKNGVNVRDFTFKNLSKWYNIPEQLSLSYTNNFITFEFVGINTNNPQTVRYQYRLDGLEKAWSAISNRSEASYGNLSPGAYTFRVKAMNEAGYWSKEVAYAFSIRPPWWETWWAYTLYGLLAGGLVYGIIQYRVAQGLEKIRATEAIRTKISSDLHDDVGSILSGLAMQSQMMALTAQEAQKEPLNELSAMSHDAMERMRDTVWAMDSRKDKYENLIDRMRAFAEKNLNLKQITHEFDLQIEDTRKFIDPQKRQNIYLIFKEAITNLCKHADATHVIIRFTQEKEQLRLLIHDNGSAKQVVNSDGLGLHNMKMRAAQLGGRLLISYDEGFKLELLLE